MSGSDPVDPRRPAAPPMGFLPLPPGMISKGDPVDVPDSGQHTLIPDEVDADWIDQVIDDPQALARKLAEHAARLQQARVHQEDDPVAEPVGADEPSEATEPAEPPADASSTDADPDPGSDEPAPEPSAPPTPVDPVALARRLAEEAKARQAPREDPAALARRLAAEAKARQAPREDPAALARRLAEEAKARAAAAAPPKPAARPKPAPKPGSPLSALAASAPKVARPMSATEALARSRAEEAAPKAAPKAAAPPAPAPVKAPGPTPPSVPAPRAPVDASAAVASVLEGWSATIPEARAVADRRVLKALWQAHRARAHATGDLALLVTAGLIVDASERVGTLVVARVDVGGQSFAAFVDGDRGVLLGLVQPSAVYLAGL